MRHSEWLASVYFLWLMGAAWARELPSRSRWLIIVGSAALLAVIVWISRAPWPIVRDWAPGPYILVGYYLSGHLFARPAVRMEQWLAAWDRRLFGDPARFRAWPAALLAYLEIVYMGCFLVVPIGLAALIWSGHAAQVDRFWTMVVAAEFGAFAPLAVVQTRPPWALEPAPPPRDALHRVAALFVRRGTIGANTFPSGHVAGSLTVAFALIGVWPAAGFVLLALALSIAAACIVGRYHYGVDVIAGAALASIIWAVVAAAGI